METCEEERMKAEWVAEWRRETIKKYIRHWKDETIEENLALWKKECIGEVQQKHLEEFKREVLLHVAKNLTTMGESADYIAKATGLRIEEVGLADVLNNDCESKV